MEPASAPPSLESLIEAHGGLLFRIALRLTGSSHAAEDVVQETMLTAHRKLDQLRDGAAARAWLIAVLRSHVREHHRRSRRSATIVDLDQLEEAATGDPPIDGSVDIDEEKLRRLIDELPDEFREPLVLFYFRELKYHEIADACERPIGTVMSRISRGKAWLRKRLLETNSAPESIVRGATARTTTTTPTA